VDVPFSPGWWAAAPPAPPVSETPESLLAAAGWTRGADGTLARDGRPLALELLTAAGGAREQSARALAAAWNALGARVTVTPAPADALLSPRLVPRDYQAALITWDPGPDPDPFSAWHSSLRGRPDGNLSDTADPDLDRFAEQGRAAPRIPARAEAYRAFAERFRAIEPGIVVAADTWTYILRPSVRGVDLHAMPDAAARFANVQQWHVRTRRE
jgi:peptide/nickel transport system substrate-binding protein